MPKNLSSVIIKTFHELDKQELYKFMQLRIEVFIVEQDCPYQDLDDLDSQGTHMWIEEEGVVLTYLRLNPPGTRFKEPSLGRIVTKESARSRGLAEIIINKALEIIEASVLFNIKSNNIAVTIHPEHIIHGLVHYKDGSIIANLGLSLIHI